MNGRPYRICLIEDDELMGEALVDRFYLEGFDCEWFKPGETARAALSRKQYDVVVRDIGLPDANGEVFYEDMHEPGMPLPPCIFIAGHGAIDRAVRLLNRDAEACLTTPFDVRVLLEKVRTLCMRGSPCAAGGTVREISSAKRNLEARLPRKSSNSSTSGSLGDYLRECERRYIERTLTENSGRIGDSAEVLGISRKSLWEKMRKLHVRVERAPRVSNVHAISGAPSQ